MKGQFTTSAIALLLSACVTSSSSLDVRALEDFYVQDFTSREPHACTAADVRLSHAQSRAFFLRAKPIDSKTLHDHYEVAPCQIEGTARRGGHVCNWSITAAAVGQIRCGERTWLFACDDCDDLFGRPRLSGT